MSFLFTYGVVAGVALRRFAATLARCESWAVIKTINLLFNCSADKTRMRPLTDTETRAVLEKLAKL